MIQKLKDKKKLILSLILVFVFGTVTGVAAYNVYANQVLYDNTTSGLTSTNVNDAIDELYDKANNQWCKKGYTKGGNTQSGGYECVISHNVSNATWIVDAGSSYNNAVYTFNLSNGTTVSTSDANYNSSSITGAGTVDSYSVSGDNSTPRFYMLDTSLISPSETWQTSYTATNLTTNTIGSGKTNTASMLARSDRGTAFDYIASMNRNSTGGYNDWFIGSRAEYGLFGYTNNTTTTLPTTSTYFWSSVEDNSRSIWEWDCYYVEWDTLVSKDDSNDVLPLRSF